MDKVNMSSEDALRLIAKSLEMGKCDNALRILGDIGRTVNETKAQLAAANQKIARLEADIETMKYGATKLIKENEKLCEKNDKLEARLEEAEGLLGESIDYIFFPSSLPINNKVAYELRKRVEAFLTPNTPACHVCKQPFDEWHSNRCPGKPDTPAPRHAESAMQELLSSHDSLYREVFKYLPDCDPRNDLAAKAARAFLAPDTPPPEPEMVTVRREDLEITLSRVTSFCTAFQAAAHNRLKAALEAKEGKG